MQLNQINLQAFFSAEPIVLGWLGLMLVLFIGLPLGLAIRWIFRKRKPKTPNLLD